MHDSTGSDSSRRRRVGLADAVLPVFEIEDALVAALGKAGPRRIVVHAPTGSGKSTQIPQIVRDSGCVGDREVVVLQPRRMAARMLARRVAWERGGSVGGEVGYQVRFERAVGPGTRIRFVTEGILLRELLRDPALSSIGAVVFDEFHERHLYGDVTLARVLEVQESLRNDLAILVMSATLQSELVDAYLGDAAVSLRSEGRTFPVEIRHVPPRSGLDKTLPEQVVRACRDHVAAAGLEGDVLVFLPGVYEIRKTVDLLQADRQFRGYDIRPLYGELPPKQQDLALEPSERPRIVVATNVAETSLTIEGVRVVVDAGLARQAAYDPRRGINTLTVEKISKASADQRAGRAGRTAAGVALRLWSERDHAARPDHERPEVQRLDLAEVALVLKAAGIDDLERFRWVEAPDSQRLGMALDLLVELEAIEDPRGPITDRGRMFARFPLHPRHAAVMVAAAESGCLQEAALAIALEQGRGIFLSGGRGGRGPMEAFAARNDASDFWPQLRAWQLASQCGFDISKCGPAGIRVAAAREAGALASRLVRLARDAGLPGADEPDGRGMAGQAAGAANLGKALLAGFPDHVAVRFSEGSGGFFVVGGRRGKIAENSIIRDARLVVAAEITEIEGKELRVVLGNLTVVEEDWLRELFPHAFRKGAETVWDAQGRRVLRREATLFHDLVLESRERGEPDAAEAAALLAGEVLDGRLVLKQWDDSVEQWIARVNCLARWMPELEFPAIGPDDRRFLVEQVCLGATCYRDIKERSPWKVLHSWLSAPQRAALDAYAPERVELAGGRKAKVRYAEDQLPRVSAVLQTLYDQKANPTIAGGRVTVVIEILGPNHRPVQVTQDIGAFWETSYPEVRKQLRGRYPKHEWR